MSEESQTESECHHANTECHTQAVNTVAVIMGLNYSKAARIDENCCTARKVVPPLPNELCNVIIPLCVYVRERDNVFLCVCFSLSLYLLVDVHVYACAYHESICMYTCIHLYTHITKDDRAGIGVVLGVRSDGALYIHKICAGGAAEGTSLMVGDGIVCVRVDVSFHTRSFSLTRN